MYFTKLSKVELLALLLHHSKVDFYRDDSLLKHFREFSGVQLDPLNPAWRNHDIFFLSRVKNYKLGQFETELYEKKETFEAYLPNLYALSMKYFPIFYARKQITASERLGEFLKNHPEKPIEVVLKASEDLRKFTRANFPELAHSAAISTWKTNSLISTTLEYLWSRGELVVSGRTSNFNKVYSGRESFVPSKYNYPAKLTKDQIEFLRFRIKLRSYPLISLGKKRNDKYSKSRSIPRRWFTPQFQNALPEEFQFAPILFYESDGWVYASEKKPANPSYDGNIRALAPLDPIIWDRDMTERLFDFVYRWEVYTPKSKRIYGYYSYPLLRDDKILGRTELSTKEGKAQIFNFHSDVLNMEDLSDLVELWTNSIIS